MDEFDLTLQKPLHERLRGVGAGLLILAFKSDWLYPAYQSQEILRACKQARVDATYCEINSTYGHDAFLLEVEEQTHLITYFLRRIAGATSGTSAGAGASLGAEAL
jgi:homoserine O-acetyltransferase